MALALDFEEGFLTHKTRAGGSTFLSRWKEDGQVTVWIHPDAPIFSLWSHSWTKFGTDVDEETEDEVQVIYTSRSNCLEKEALLKKQQFRDKKTGDRKYPPTICPHCLAVEWVRGQINAGKLDWTVPVFKWQVEGPVKDLDEEKIIYAGGFTGQFNSNKLSKREVKEIRAKTGVKQSEAFLQSGLARQQYVFIVASEADLDAGWVIAMEGQTIGQLMQRCIRDEIENNDGDIHKGHPKYNPYPFKWKFDDNKEFKEKYAVVALTKHSPGDRMVELFKEPPPEVDRLIAEPKLGTLYDEMKAAALIDMPLDEFFEKAFEEFGKEYESDEEESDGEEADDDSALEVKGEDDSEDGAEETDSEEGDNACEVCGEEMGEEDLVCKGCGTKYELDEEGYGYIVTRPCGNPDCMEKAVEVDENGEGTCGQCGAVHDNAWTYTLPEKKAASKKKRSKKVGKRPSKHADARPSKRSQARSGK